MARMRHLVPRLAVAVAIGLALALVIDIARAGGAGAWLAGRGLPPPYLPAGTRVDIGGRSLYLDCRGEGGPTVILESGMGEGAASWSPVHDALAATTRTCAYDRAGRGSSDPAGRRTLREVAQDLAALLETAGAAPPYVVVAHSFGGDVARVFADQQSDRVAAVVLLDTFHPDLEAASIHPLLGDLRAEYEARLDGLRAMVASVEALDWATSEAQLRATSLAGIPIEVLRAARYEPRLDEATNAAIAAASVAAHEAMSPGNVRYELVPGAGHVIHWDRPDRVIEVVRAVIADHP